MRNEKSSGFFLTALLLILITLKLCNVIEWSWLWVLSPAWMPIVFLVLILAIIGLIECCQRKGWK